MNGKQCKSLRAALGIKKPTVASGGYVYFDLVTWRWMFCRRNNPQLNMYRNFKRWYSRTWRQESGGVHRVAKNAAPSGNSGPLRTPSAKLGDTIGSLISQGSQ